MLGKLVKLALNQGVKKSDVSDVAMQIEHADGIYLVGMGATISIVTKKVLTPRERLRRNLITLFK